MTASDVGSEDEKPNIARVYDWLLGGSHNFAADREFGEQLRVVWPHAPATMRANRAFMGRAVRYLAGPAGIRQFLDIGSGIPTMGNVHQVAQAANPECRIAYVDNDPVAVQHSRAILARNDRAVAVRADLRRPGELLGQPELRTLLDFSRPVALLLVAILHFLPDAEDPETTVARLREALAPGSCLVLTHGTADGQPGQVGDAMELYSQATAPIQLRSRASVLRFFHGFDLIEPGLVRIPEWRPDDPADAGTDSGRVAGYAAAGRKPR